MPLSSFRPAHVPRVHGVQVEAGIDLGVPTGAFGTAIEVGERLAQRARSQETLSREEQLQLFDAGVKVALNPPGFLQHATVAFSPYARTEVSLRVVGGGFGVGGRYQLLEQGFNSTWDLTVGLSGMRQSYSFPIDKIIDVVDLRGFQRFTVDFPVALGRRGRWYRVWGGPRVLWTTSHGDLSLTLPSTPALSASIQSQGLYYGMQGGFALGYDHVFLGVELNLVAFRGSGTLDARTVADRQITEVNRTLDLDGFVIYPGVALMGEF